MLKQRIILKNIKAFLLKKMTPSITEMERLTIKYGIRDQCYGLPNEHVSSLQAWQAFGKEKQKIYKNFSSASKGLQDEPC